MNKIKRTFGFIHRHPLAKRHLIRAYCRFIIWQIRSRVNLNLQKVLFLGKTSFVAKRGMAGITGNIYAGLHEFNDMGFLLHFLRPEDTFCDVGANVGAYTLLASSICKAKSIAFEPVPSTFDILKKNIQINNLDELVVLENKGADSEKRVLQFSSDEDTTNHVIAENEEALGMINVDTISLDEYILKNSPQLIKIDVEGFEMEVIKGAQRTLDHPNLKALIIELVGCGFRYGYNEDEIHQKLLSLSFKSYTYDPLKRVLSTINKQSDHSNTIYIKDLDFVLNRIKSAPHFEIFGEKI